MNITKEYIDEQIDFWFTKYSLEQNRDLRQIYLKLTNNFQDLRDEYK